MYNFIPHSLTAQYAHWHVGRQQFDSCVPFNVLSLRCECFYFFAIPLTVWVLCPSDSLSLLP